MRQGIIDISLTDDVHRIKPYLHSHEGIQFVWLNDFAGKMLRYHDVCDVRKADLCMIDEGIPHLLISEAEYIHAINILISPEGFNAVAKNSITSASLQKQYDYWQEMLGADRAKPVLHISRSRQNYVNRLTNGMLDEFSCCQEDRELFLNNMFNDFVFQVLASIPLNDAERSSTIRDIKEYLIEHIHEPFDLDKLSAEFTFNKSHLCRIFKENEHKTMYQFLSEIRIQEACRLMQQTQRNLTDIAISLGFASYSQFSICFYRQYATSPSRWRSANR